MSKSPSQNPQEDPEGLYPNLEPEAVKREKEDEEKIFEEEIKRTLTPQQLQQVNKGTLKISDIKKKLKEDSRVAHIHLEQMLREEVVDYREYKGLKEKTGKIRSTVEMDQHLKEIQELPKKKETAKAKENEDAKELTPEDPKLIELQKKFNQICDKNQDLIGLKQLSGFKNWFQQEIAKNPTIKNGNEIIRRLEGKEITDRNGLAPRREELKNLERLFQRHKLGSPLKSDYIKQEGLSERREFRKNAEHLENHLQKIKNTGFYSQKMVRETMRTILTANSPNEQINFLNRAKNIAKKEGENFVHLNSTINIQGVTVKKMSNASRDMLMQYYKNADFKEREQTNWKKLVEHEARLSYELADIYEDDPEGLKWAFKSFSLLDFMSKQKALKDHKKLVKEGSHKKEAKISLITKAAHAEIDEAARKKIFSEKTRKNYTAFFQGEGKGKDYIFDKNGKPDAEKLQKAYNILTSSTPDNKSMNIAAYAENRKEYFEHLHEHPEMDASEIKKRKNEYDKEGWANREKLHEEFHHELEKAQADHTKKRKLENKVHLEKNEKEHLQENALNLEETIRTASELLHAEQGAEALKVLLTYNEIDPDNPKILFWIETVSKYMREFGSGKTLATNTNDELQEAVDNSLNSSEFEEDLEDIQIETLAQEGARLEENHHGHAISAKERAEEESLEEADDELEEDLIKDFYQKTDEYHILNEDKTGEKVYEASYGDTEMDENEKASLKREIYREQSKISTEEGINIELKDKDGRQISAREAEIKEEEKVVTLAHKIAKAGTEKSDAKTGGKAPSAFDKAQRLAIARKAAEEKIHKKRFEKLETA